MKPSSLPLDSPAQPPPLRGRSSLPTSLAVALMLPWVLTACQSRPVQPHPQSIRPLDDLFHQPSPALQTVIADPPAYRLQVLVSEVVPRSGKHPRVHRFGFRVDAEYFYPASSIKLCAAVAALETLQHLRPPESRVDLVDAPLVIEPLFEGDTRQTEDTDALPSPEPRPITVYRELRKLALVSDNQAYNRLYDLVGHEQLNRSMHALGLESVVLNHRLSDPRTLPNPLASAEVVLLPQGGPDIRIPARISRLHLTNHGPGLKVGTGYLKGDALIREPMDFTSRNGISLVDLQNLLIQVVRPDVHLGLPPLSLEPNHRALLVKALTEYPRESADPRYPAADYPDHYCKFLLPGVRRVFPSTTPGERVEITGKIGRAYGFTVENACLTNPANGRTVFVTAVLYTNTDGILNDDRYEYSTLADPFFEDLGERIARRWLADPSTHPTATLDRLLPSSADVRTNQDLVTDRPDLPRPAPRFP